MKKNKVKLLILALLRRSGYLISFPVSLVLVAISPFYRIRFIGLQSGRIGHYALNTELLLCEMDDEARDSTKGITLFYNMTLPCNEQLDIMWRRIVPFFPLTRLAIQIDMIMSWLMKTYKNDRIKQQYEPCSGAVDQNDFLKNKKPHLYFTDKEKEQAHNLLKQMGIESDQKYVCLIVRDSAYLQQMYPGQSWSYHDHRNANIEKYKKAALYLAQKGYVVFRMGKCVNQSFSVSHPRIIDYANSNFRSDFMDIYLCATCFFCISTCTGLDCVSQIFRRPILMTDISPVFAETLLWYPCTLYLPKLLKMIGTNRVLGLSETAKICKELSQDILKGLLSQGLEINENTQDEILEAVEEMELRVLDQWEEKESDQYLQFQYWENYKKHRPVNVNKIYLKLGSEYLRKNNNIMLA